LELLLLRSSRYCIDQIVLRKEEVQKDWGIQSDQTSKVHASDDEMEGEVLDEEMDLQDLGRDYGEEEVVVVLG
jgi:hypothetical protein